jgi:hypothetical protein
MCRRRELTGRPVQRFGQQVIERLAHCGDALNDLL